MKTFKKWTAKALVIALIIGGGIWISSSVGAAPQSPVPEPPVPESPVPENIPPQQFPENIPPQLKNYLSLPHTFQAGKEAIAAAVNANFKYLLDAFNKNFRFEGDPKTVGIVGHIKTLPPTGGKAPTTETCVEVEIKGTDTAGMVKFEVEEKEICMIKFAVPFADPPACVVSSSRFNRAGPISAITSVSWLYLLHPLDDPIEKGEIVSYICLGL